MIKKQAMLWVVLFLIAFTQQISSAETEPWVKVGLDYGDTTLDAVSLESDSGFTLTGLSGGTIDLSDYETLSVEKAFLSYASESASALSENDKGIYHLVIGEAYSSYAEAEAARLASAEICEDAFPFFEKDWYLLSGNYTSSEAASEALITLKTAHPEIKATIAEPNFGRVLVRSGETVLLGYNASDEAAVFTAPLIQCEGTTYRSGILIKRYTNSDLTVINQLSLSEYLYGVVPKEMGTGWPIEALKAQAVAARNYALMNLGKYSEYGFDFTTGTSSQAYGGYAAEKPDTNRAVDETKGIVLTYDGDLIQCYYHANSGGYTEFAGNVWSSNLPYLQPVQDTYSLGYPNTDWTLSLSGAEIEQRLSAGGYEIGSLQSVRILERSVTGRVVKIAFDGTKSSAVLTNDRPRSIFGSTILKSMLFSFDDSKAVTAVPTSWPMPGGLVALDDSNGGGGGPLDDGVGVVSGEGIYGELSSEDVLTVFTTYGEYEEKIDRIGLLSGKTTPIETTVVPNALSYSVSEKADLSNGTLTLYGHGYGHGVGLSQWGAKKMAELGFTFDQILTYYFKGTQIAYY